MEWIKRQKRKMTKNHIINNNSKITLNFKTMMNDNGNYFFWGMHMFWWLFMFVFFVVILVWLTRFRKRK
jgi:hypothetical protein